VLFDLIDDAIAVDEAFSKIGIIKFRHDAAGKWKAVQSSRCPDYLRDYR
jgi:hypothetical protein